MFKKVTTLLLVFILLVQLISPVLNVNADEGREDVDIIIDYDMEQIEIDEISEEILEVDEVEELSEVEIDENDEEETSEIDEIVEELSELDEEVEEETIIEVLNTGQVLEQATIDAMYEFLANNSMENPLIVPRGSNFLTAINALGWGEGVTVRLIGYLLTGCETQGPITFSPNDPLCFSDIDLFSGALWMYLNLIDDGYSFDDVYFFGGVVYFLYEGATTEQSTVWTDEEIAFFHELATRYSNLDREAWLLFMYINDMYHTSVLSEHPNGAELYRLRDQFIDYINSRNSFFDNTLPFTHQYNVNALVEVQAGVEFLESFIAQITAALDDEVENNSNSNNQQTLPQTGTGVALNTMLTGSGLVALGGLTTYKKLKKN